MDRAPRTLVLGSTSPFRRELLERLGLAFATCAPDVDETPRSRESPEAMVARLARAKAEAVRDRFPDALIIGSDQCAELDGRILGKPGGHDRAVAQLSAASGRSVAFHTGLCLLDAGSGERQEAVVPFRVHFRALSRGEIEDYVRREKPYGCAGSFKSEGLGIALFERLEGDDPTALIGLPLIRLCRMLARAGIPVLGNPAADCP
ncbi:Maf family protein [Ectothiorhodospira lacustris]|uniref:Maf family protein n=1 Tax=Ectothiorhodospira lacustris TaxID=2899127 RepID=UPI001EE94167|nr:Maf family nucleotide pyrophosphatase [Ectothiorhodospira lacustris]MCG5500562.1 Maf family nucleotide pyrophosphatase [Ectothiorhodospira lacustris]MCG5509365.1 Maf family nucleotide pyrophosphatase [Ectothiorhodospira lacustris]MCG5521419.1 Maf family nucleotide pyrophosphatase [Ectothiorhodospira lacustris]